MARIRYLELPASDVDLALRGGAAEATGMSLAIIRVDDLTAAEAAVAAADGSINRADFAFPDGRRSHLRDPAGKRIAALVDGEG